MTSPSASSFHAHGHFDWTFSEDDHAYGTSHKIKYHFFIGTDGNGIIDRKGKGKGLKLIRNVTV